MAYKLNKNQTQLLDILRRVHPDLKNDKRCLKDEYDGLRGKIERRRDISQNNRTVKCRNQGCGRNHLLYFCQYENCEICGIRGHQRQICDTPIYYINLLCLCKCDGREIKRIRTHFNRKGDPIARHGTHCCYCKNPTPLEEMEVIGERMLCEYCERNERRLNENNKQTITPKSP